MWTMARGAHALREFGCFFDTRTCNKISLSISLMIILTSKSLFCGVPSSPELSSTLAALWRSCMAVLVWHTAASHGQCMCCNSRHRTKTSEATSVTQFPIALHPQKIPLTPRAQHPVSGTPLLPPFMPSFLSHTHTHALCRPTLASLHEGSSLLS